MCGKPICGDMTQKLIREDWKKQDKEMDYLLECKECLIAKYEDPKQMCADGCVKIPPPKTAYEIMMEKKKKDVTMWFTDSKCRCGHDIYTDGKLFWCSDGCWNNGKRGPSDREGFGFISDLIR